MKPLREDTDTKPADVAAEALQEILGQSADDLQPISVGRVPKRGIIPGEPHSQLKDAMLVNAIVGGASVRGALKAAGYNPNGTSVRKRLNNQNSSLRRKLEKKLHAAGLSLDDALGTLKAQMTAEELHVTKSNRYAWPDNQARLRATENVLKLHEKIGAIPASDAHSHGAGGTTVQIIMYHQGDDTKRVIDSE